MIKIKKSILKRVKRTKKGKIIFSVPGRSHNLAKKEKKVKRIKKSVVEYFI